MGGIAHCLVAFQLELEIGEDEASETVQTVQIFHTVHTVHTVLSHQFTENLSGLDGFFAFVSQAKALK
jgi:hypothetical protein